MPADWIAPIAIAGAAVALGWVVEWTVMPWVRTMAARTSLWVDDLVLGATKGIAFWWIALIGLMVATSNSPMLPENRHYLEQAIKFLWVMSATVVVTRIAGRGVDQRVAAAGLPHISLLGNLIRAVVVLVGVLVAFNTIGVSITPVLTALGVGGLAVALALQPTLSNLFSGIQLLASKKLRPGDFIRLDGGDEGDIVDITWRDTTIRTPTGNLVIIPNHRLAEATVMNYTLDDPAMTTVLQIGVAYGSDLAQVEVVTRTAIAEAVGSFPGLVPEFTPVVRFDGFADSSITLVIVVRVRTRVDQFMARHHLVMAIHRHFAAAGIEIPFPMRTVITRPA